MSRRRFFINETDVPAGNGYLSFQSGKSFSLRANTPYWNGTMEYYDNKNWVEWDGSSIYSDKNNAVYIRGRDNTEFSTSSYTSQYTNFVLNGTAVIDCIGNIETILDHTVVENGQHPVMGQHAFSGLFLGCSWLRRAPELPFEVVTYSAYRSMFESCNSLEFPPELPATTLANVCYYKMFKNCIALKYAPTLPATNINDSSLASCYGEMFYGCKNLKSIKIGYTGELPPPAIKNATKNWVYDVSQTGDFYYNGTSESRGADAIPDGWTVHTFTD